MSNLRTISTNGSDEDDADDNHPPAGTESHEGGMSTESCDSSKNAMPMSH